MPWWLIALLALKTLVYGVATVFLLYILYLILGD